jgi:hypothetical protein
MSRKSVLITQLAEDEAIKDAFRQFAARIVNTTKLSSFPLENYMQSAISSSDEESDQPLCQCKCQSIKQNNCINGINCEDICSEMDPNETNSNNYNINTQSNNNENNFIKTNNNNNNHCESCECISCLNIKKSNENANKLIADEERKKKRSEKKKAQKKKKKDKKKAEKLSNDLEKANNKSETNNEGFNSNNGSDGKIDDDKDNKNETKKKNTSSDNNKQNKNIKQKTNTKEVDKSVAKQIASNNRESDKHSSNKSSPKSERENEVLISDVEEEELSFSSAYVSQIAQRKSKPSKTIQLQSESVQDYSYSDESLKNSSNSYVNNNNTNNDNNYSTNKANKEINEELPKNKTIAEQKQKPTKVLKENKLQNIDKSIELAILANQKAEALKFNEAIDLFSQALVYNPSDYRFYVNRSYCYDSIQDYRSALRDAEIAIQIRSDWPKCHYRKGKALAGLKNYEEAEMALKKVISIEKDCAEALTELWNVRYGAIVDMGYDASTANIYASQYDTIKEALDALSIKGPTNLKTSNNSLNSSNSFVNCQTSKKPINNSWNSSFASKNDLPSTNGFDDKTGSIWEDDDIYISDDEYNSVRNAVSFEETSLVFLFETFITFFINNNCFSIK